MGGGRWAVGGGRWAVGGGRNVVNPGTPVCRGTVGSRRAVTLLAATPRTPSAPARQNGTTTENGTDAASVPEPDGRSSRVTTAAPAPMAAPTAMSDG